MKIRIRFALILFSIWLISCTESADEHTNETIQPLSALQDSLPATVPTLADTFPLADPVDRFHFRFGHLISNEYDTLENTGHHFLERFAFSSMNKLKLKKRSAVSYGEINGIIPEAEVWMFCYPDSIKRINAMNNWLNCFGRDCTPVKLREPLKAVKTIPSMALIKDSLILVLEWPCEHKENDWEKITHLVDSTFSNEGTAILNVECGGPLSWK